MNEEIAEQLEEKIEEIEAALEEMEDLINQSGNEGALSRAQAYWIAHITTALRKETQYLGGSMCCAEETIHEILGDARCTICKSRIQEDEVDEHLKSEHGEMFVNEEELMESMEMYYERIEE